MLLCCFPTFLFSQIGQSNIGNSTIAGITNFEASTAIEGIPMLRESAENCCFLFPIVPVPVALLSFKATLNLSRTVDLSWTTANEINNNFFEVEHSIDGITFSPIAKVLGQGTTANPTAYKSEHTDPAVGTNYYRLRQVDFDDQFAYSEIEKVEVPQNNKLTFQVYPNPSSDRITLVLNGMADVSVIDLYGRKLFTQRLGDRQILDISQLETGMYILQMEQNGKRRKLVFVKN